MNKIAAYEMLLEDHPLWSKEAEDDITEQARLGAKMRMGGEVGSVLSMPLAHASKPLGVVTGLGSLGSRIAGSYKTRDAARAAGIGDDYEGSGSFTRRNPFLSSITPVLGAISADRLAQEVARRRAGMVDGE